VLCYRLLTVEHKLVVCITCQCGRIDAERKLQQSDIADLYMDISVIISAVNDVCKMHVYQLHC